MARYGSQYFLNQETPPKTPLQLWSWPHAPGSHVHVDFAGPMAGGKMYLFVIDAHSKWMEVVPMGVCSPLMTIQVLQTQFTQFGIPKTIVYNNGPKFVARKFENFRKANGFRCIQVAPYHPATNGLYVFSRRV